MELDGPGGRPSSVVLATEYPIYAINGRCEKRQGSPIRVLKFGYEVLWEKSNQEARSGKLGRKSMIPCRDITLER